MDSTRVFLVFEERSTTGKKRQELFVRFRAHLRKNAVTRGGWGYKAGRDQDAAPVLTRVQAILSRSASGNIVLKRARDPAVNRFPKKTGRVQKEAGQPVPHTRGLPRSHNNNRAWQAAAFSGSPMLP
jgi:hypothetical protein